MGLTVRSTLCLKCPLRNECGYMLQERQVENLVSKPEGLVLFAPPQYAFLPLPAEVKPELAVFDERPSDFAVEDISLSFQDLEASFQFGGLPYRASEKTLTEAAVDAHEIAQNTLQPLLRNFALAMQSDSSTALDQLRKSGVDLEIVDKALKNLHFFYAGRVVSSLGDSLKDLNLSGQRGRPASKLLMAQLLQSNPPRVDKIKTFLEVLRDELSGTHATPISIVQESADIQDAESSQAPGIKILRIRPLLHGVNAPFLYLDGTGDEEIAKAMFGSDLIIHHYPVERNAVVTQVVGCQFSRQYVCGEGRGGKPAYGDIAQKSCDLREHLDTVLKGHDTAAVFATKKIIQKLGLEGSPRAGHFGALRGLNRWEDYDSVIIIGREQPPLSAVELIARAYALKTNASFMSAPAIWEWRGIRIEDGAVPVRVLSHPDPWVKRILYQIREAEAEQAIDRIRLIHNTELKQVFLLSEMALDITVDRVVHWDDFKRGGSRIECAARKYNVIPLEGREAARLLPDIWNNHETANSDLAPLRLTSGMVYNNSLYTNSDTKELCRVKYKRSVSKPERARTREAIVCGPAEIAQSVLEKVTGKLDGFEIVACDKIPEN
ncbi:hypothetical protein [Falsihalocynthiibacter arcticus]|nr:hypothetical protein [Falsihalocynthiibacter arcticus]